MENPTREKEEWFHGNGLLFTMNRIRIKVLFRYFSILNITFL